MATVAVVGVGRIGAALVGRLRQAGHDVTAFDIRAERRAVVEKLGGRWAPSVTEVVGAVDVVFTVLPGSPELQHLVLTTDELLTNMRQDAVWIDLTSASHSLSQRCAQRAAELGIASLGAPLGGGVDAVQAGTAILYVGGDPEVLQAATPVLRAFAGTVHHAGGTGAGHLAKLLINLLWFGQVGLVTEAMLLAQRLELPPHRMAALLAGGAADSTFVQQHLPSLLASDYLANFGFDRCVEELTAVEQAATVAGTPRNLIGAVTELHRAALSRFGPIDGEMLAAAWLEEQAGRRLAGD